MITEQEHRIIGLIYDAVLDHQWDRVLAEIAQYTQSSSGVFISSDQLDAKANFLHVYNLSQQFIDTYQLEEIRFLDMHIHQPLLQQGGGIGIASDIDWSIFSTMQGTDEQILYENCLQPSGLAYGAGVLLDGAKYRWAFFAVHRTCDMSAYSQKERVLLENFAIHMRRALHIYRQFHLIQQQQQNFYDLLDGLNMGIILVDQYSHLNYANQKAQQILENSSLLWLDRYNHLKAKNHFQVKLNQYITSIFSEPITPLTGLEQVGGELLLYQQSDRPELKLSIMPFSRLSSLNVNERGKQAVIFITPAKRHYQLVTKHLSQVYQLSKREITICELFINGRNLDEIAKELSITLSSLRTYFKYIYEKTGCSSQLELMHLLMSVTLDFEHII